MRLDQLLCRLRLVKSRGLAQRLIDTGHVRCNGIRVNRVSHGIAVGDVLTIPLPGRVTVLSILALPERRGPASEAQACYRVLDARGETAIAAGEGTATKGTSSP